MKPRRLLLIVLAAVLTMLGACQPKPTVAPQPAITPAPTPRATGAQATLSPQTPSAWEKVVAEARKEGQVTLYSFGFTGDVGSAVAQGFRKAYGIRVDIVTGIGTVLMERIRSENRAGKFIADTYDTSVVFVAQAKSDGLTVGAGDLPEVEANVWQVPPRMDKEGHIFGTTIAATTLYVNTSLVKPGDEPKSYRDLLDPRWKGKLVFPAPVTTPNAIRAYVAYKKYGVLDDTYWSQLGKQDLKVAPTIRDLDSMLARGEAAIEVSGVDSTVNPFIKGGAPVKPINVAEGIVVATGSPAIAMVKNGPHPNAARLFINWFFSREGQRAYHEARASTSPRKDLSNFAPAAGLVSMDKTRLVDMDMELETGRLQREGTFSRLMGIEAK
ncbi:MAG: extracellular solute-binding protein [Chloroflexi bacterium]|nr:extracellular solute-binding protein [Chloroflexota bacterium]